MMIQSLINYFEKKQQEKKTTNLHIALGVFAGKIGFFLNILLFIIKLIIGLISGSVSIMADAMNNLSDTVSSILTLVGFYISGKPADQNHPYGHERFEYISGMLVSISIIVVGFRFLTSSIERIKTPQAVHINSTIIFILLFSILIKVWQGVFYKKIAEKIHSETLIASSKDSIYDVYITISVLISASIQWLTRLEIDGYVSFLIACYIIVNGILLIRGFINELIGMRPNQKEIDKMKKYLASVPSIVGYHDLLIHQYGPRKTFASVHIEIDDRLNLNEAHEIVDQIEQQFKDELAVDLVCHIDPVNLHDTQQQFVRKEIRRIVQEIHQELKIHDIRLDIHEKPAKILFDLVLPATVYPVTEEELTKKIQQKVNVRIGDYSVIITFDHTYLL